MSIPRTARLDDELHCLSAEPVVVITAQRWTSDDGRSWLRVLRNGRPKMNRGRPVDVQFSGEKRTAELEAEWKRITEAFAPTRISAEQAWGRLPDLPRQCQRGDRCAAQQILGWPICPGCGAHERHVAGGSMSGVRGRMLAHPVVFSPSDK